MKLKQFKLDHSLFAIFCKIEKLEIVLWKLEGWDESEYVIFLFFLIIIKSNSQIEIFIF